MKEGYEQIPGFRNWAKGRGERQGCTSAMPNVVESPNVVDVPFGLDDPAPILVWRSGLRTTGAPDDYDRWLAVFPSEDEAEKSNSHFIAHWPHLFRVGGPPFRTPLEDAMKLAAFKGCHGVQLCDWQENVIEEYPL